MLGVPYGYTVFKPKQINRNNEPSTVLGHRLWSPLHPSPTWMKHLDLGEQTGTGNMD